MKPGIKTSELWLAVGAAIISLLVSYGVLTLDEAEAWQGVVAAVVPLALAIVSAAYSNSRARVKTGGA